MSEIDSHPDHTRGVLRQNERLCIVWVPKLGLAKARQHSMVFFVIFYNLMSFVLV